jgi:hypothetical protein
MKHLRKINEWKNSEDEKFDEDNIKEIEDVFLPLKDMDCEKFEIEVDGHISQSYNIKWTFPISLSIGSYPDKVTSESIKAHKDKLMRFNKTQEETHEILETLIGMGYEIAYYRVEQSVDGRANSIFNFYIRMSRVN